MPIMMLLNFRTHRDADAYDDAEAEDGVPPSCTRTHTHICKGKQYANVCAYAYKHEATTTDA